MISLSPTDYRINQIYYISLNLVRLNTLKKTMWLSITIFLFSTYHMAFSTEMENPKFKLSIDTEPEINTTIGIVKGRIWVASGGKILTAFMGIPYAEPPVDALRFMVS
jgi:Carboxylesterase family